MLCNDSVTVAIEIPIWLREHDIAALEWQLGVEIAPRSTGTPRIITGHLDFLQIRNGAVHILDYKPDAGTNRPIAQLTIYALALTRLVAGLRLFDIKCAWFAGESTVEVSVSDSGTGIPEHKLGEIFETFYTTKEQGTGLGLSVARTIIETYDGKIWAQNQPGGGAVFRFALPSIR